MDKKEKNIKRLTKTAEKWISSQEGKKVIIEGQNTAEKLYTKFKKSIEVDTETLREPYNI
ncbi:hypothetical protein ACFL27_27430 [candidate division CSSED10-310 bacterium]|uniref:Uncharacterized protein n=1 Tax=candidate division CSSED10-310 bacterium TaxID=2855610 RepID=A0ABV6Z6I1_UNCC1